MTEAELRKLIQACESDQLELTVSTKDTDKFSQAVCAFANDLPGTNKPGYLLIGVADDGQIKGAEVDDKLLKDLGGLIANGNIQPLPSLTVEKVVTSEGDVAVVCTQPSRLPPVRYRGRIYVRLGPRKAIGSEQDERQLLEKRVSQALTFDAQPALDSQLEDLDDRMFRIEYQPQAIAPEVIEESGRSIEQQLASLRFYDQKNGCPTHAGVLLFGKEPRGPLPGAYIQFLRIGGKGLEDAILQDHELSGDLLTILRRLDDLIDGNIARAPVETSTLRETMEADYPKVALREIVMNAVMHRDYASTAPLRLTWFDDRVEIQSPGGLYGEANAQNFPSQTSYRNPVVAEAMKALGYVNRYGRGVLRAKDALVRAGHPEPEFTLTANYVLVIVRGRG